MLLRLKNISKSFFGVLVLDGVNFDLKNGEVHALVGENGAGKSTLAKIISGLHQPDQGEISIDGVAADIFSTIESQKLGISTIYQEPLLVQDMTIAENIFLGREPSMLKLFTNSYKMKKETNSLMKQLGCSLHVNTPVRYLSASEQNMVAIAKAFSIQSKILIMDEPTASLSEAECEKLFHMIQIFKEKGVGIIYITHRLKEIFQICDRITILRNGKHVITSEVEAISEREIVKYMVGRELNHYYPPVLQSDGEELLRVEKLTRTPWFRDISFTLRKGEILGITGLVGSGSTEMAKAIFGQVKPQSGKLYWRGGQLQFENPRQAIHHRFGFVDRDRVDSSLFMDMNVSHNLTVPTLARLNKWQFIDLQKEQDRALDVIMQLDIKMQVPHQEIKFLSGGNQQKVMLGRWLVAESDLYIFDEPTRGIDVGAKSELYVAIHELVEEGKGMIIISSDLPELIGLCTRILVMREGRIVKEIPHEQATEEAIMHAASGLV